MATHLLDRTIDLSLYLPLPLVAWAAVRWFRSSHAMYSNLKRRLTQASLVMVASSSLAFALLFAILEFAPPTSEGARFRLILRGVQVGFLSGVIGTVLSLFTVKATRLVLALAGMLVSYHWYLVGNAY
jgi:hypothetical protein